MPRMNPSSGLSTFRLRRRTPGSFLLVPSPRQGRSIRCQGQLEGGGRYSRRMPAGGSHPRAAFGDLVRVARYERTFRDPNPRRPSGLSAQAPKDAGTSYIVPDFLVEMSDGRKRLVEVIPSRRLVRPIVQRKLAVGRLFALQAGWTFHLVTEKELFQGPLLDNVRMANRYRQGRMDVNLLEQLALQVPPAGIELSGLLSGRDPNSSGCLRMHVLHLLAAGRLSFDPRTRPLDDQTLIYPGGTILWDPFDSPWAPSGSSTGGPGGSSAS